MRMIEWTVVLYFSVLECTCPRCEPCTSQRTGRSQTVTRRIAKIIIRRRHHETSQTGIIPCDIMRHHQLISRDKARHRDRTSLTVTDKVKTVGKRGSRQQEADFYCDGLMKPSEMCNTMGPSQTHTVFCRINPFWFSVLSASNAASYMCFY